MIDFPYLQSITRKTSSKIIMLVADGLGGMQNPQTGLSELEAATLTADRFTFFISCSLNVAV